MIKHIECKNILIKVNDEVVGAIQSIDIEKIDDKIIVSATRIRLTKKQIESAFHKDFHVNSQFAPLQILCDDEFNTLIQNAWLYNLPSLSYSTEDLACFEQVKFNCEKIILQ